YVRVQIEESVYYLFTWTQGTFNFESDVRPERQDFLVSINPESLLLEGARRVDEWSLIEKKIPSFDLIFVVDKDRLAISEAKLTDTQQRLLTLLDASRGVNQVIEDTGLGEFEIGKALYGLITAGFVHRAGRTAPPADAQITDARGARRGGSRLRGSRDAGSDRRQGVSGQGCGGAQARRLRRRRRAARPRARAVREGTAAGLVLGPRAGRCRGVGIRAGTRPGRG